MATQDVTARFLLDIPLVNMIAKFYVKIVAVQPTNERLGELGRVS